MNANLYQAFESSCVFVRMQFIGSLLMLIYKKNLATNKIFVYM